MNVPEADLPFTRRYTGESTEVDVVERGVTRPPRSRHMRAAKTGLIALGFAGAYGLGYANNTVPAVNERSPQQEWSIDIFQYPPDSLGIPRSVGKARDREPASVVCAGYSYDVAPADGSAAGFKPRYYQLYLDDQRMILGFVVASHVEPIGPVPPCRIQVPSLRTLMEEFPEMDPTSTEAVPAVIVDEQVSR